MFSQNELVKVTSTSCFSSNQDISDSIVINQISDTTLVQFTKRMNCCNYDYTMFEVNEEKVLNILILIASVKTDDGSYIIEECDCECNFKYSYYFTNATFTSVGFIYDSFLEETDHNAYLIQRLEQNIGAEE